MISKSELFGPNRSRLRFPSITNVNRATIYLSEFRQTTDDVFPQSGGRLERSDGGGRVTSSGTVLVVDDNRAIADTYAAFLDEYDVRTAYSGREALDAVDPAVDVVLLDRRMPDLTGDEVLARMDTTALDCRVVMLTAVDPTVDIVDMDFDAYVTKPVDREAVRAVVDEMFARSEYDDEFRQFLSLLSKKATLEAEMDGAELAASEEYRRIEAKVDEQRDDLGFDTDDIEGVFAGTVPDIGLRSVPRQSANE